METVQVDNYLPVGLPLPECVIPDNLPDSDGEPMETCWHRSEIQVLIESVKVHRRGRSDYFVGGNMFLYYTPEQWATPESLKEAKFRGPDFFFVEGVDGTKPRRYWVVFREKRYPDVIIELLSDSTEKVDRTIKKDIYEKTFKTAEYFLYDPAKLRLDGWRHDGAKYVAIQPNEKGFLFSESLNLWLGTWVGVYLDEKDTWLRFYDEQFQLVPLQAELKDHQLETERRKTEEEHRKAHEEARRAEKERRTAAKERRKAEELAKSLALEQQKAAVQQAEIARLQALLGQKTQPPSDKSSAES